MRREAHLGPLLVHDPEPRARVGAEPGRLSLRARSAVVPPVEAVGTRRDRKPVRARGATAAPEGGGRRLGLRRMDRRVRGLDPRTLRTLAHPAGEADVLEAAILGDRRTVGAQLLA